MSKRKRGTALVLKLAMAIMVVYVAGQAFPPSFHKQNVRTINLFLKPRHSHF